MKHLLTIFVLTCLVSLMLPGQDANQAQTGVSLRDASLNIVGDGLRVELGDFTIENKWLRTRRKTTVHPENWRYFMHGIKDCDARPIPWSILLPENNLQQHWFDKSVSLETPIKSANLPVIKLDAKQELLLRQPVLTIDELRALRGYNLRFFIWIKGQDCGLDGNLWDSAPALEFNLRDCLNNQVTTVPSFFKTRGTFPWFCYNLNVMIPRLLTVGKEGKTTSSASANVALPGADTDEDDLQEIFDQEILSSSNLQFPDGGGLFLTLKNPGQGQVWFTALSWELVRADNTPASKDDMADPQTGSLAPNPDHDEFPMHVFFGLSAKHKWSFLKLADGTDLATNAGLVKYLKTYGNDWFHLQQGIPVLAYVHNTGTVLDQLPPFEDGWLKTLQEQLILLQDPETGLWKCNGHPDILASEAIVRNNFSPKSHGRPDRPAIDTPWLSTNGAALEHGDKIAAALLAARTGRNGQPVAWSRYAFQEPAVVPFDQQGAADLGTTTAALSLLQAVASQTEDEQLKDTIATAVNAATKYVLDNFCFDNGLWRLNENDVTPTVGAFLPTCLEQTNLAEPKVWLNAPEPDADLEFNNKGELVCTWKSRTAAQKALRIYAAPGDMEEVQINESHLLGILNQKTSRFSQLDPMLALVKIQNAARQRWNLDFATAGADYLAWKTASLSPRLVCDDSGAKRLVIPKEKKKPADDAENAEETPTSMKYYVAVVNASGQLSPLKFMFEKVAEN